ncbi:MAG: tetratricopeptide repeat protein [Candidatus Omnitrophica bacterium]|nr:tetratricopeptide repeat protein [Candidatus Omnitrophota bacterium]
MKRICFYLFLFSYVVAGPTISYAASANQEVNRGNKSFASGDFDQAIVHYEQALKKAPQSSLTKYNLGTAYYKKKEYDKAIENLQGALLSDDLKIRSNAHFNLGNVTYNLGKSKENGHLDEAIKDLEKSLQYFQKTLGVSKDDQDAQVNKDLVQKELERLKQKKDQEKNNSQSGQNNQQQKPEDSASKDQSKSDQNQNSQQSNDQKDEQNQSDSQQNQDQKQDQENPQQSPDTKKNNEEKAANKETANEQKGEQSNPKPQDSPQSNGQDQKDDSKNNPSGQQEHPSEEKQPESGSHNNSGAANQDSGSIPGQDTGMMTPKEAQMFLDDYQRNEEPKGILYFVPHQGNDKPVTKDW